MSFKIFGIKVVLTSFWWIWVFMWCLMGALRFDGAILDRLIVVGIIFTFFSVIYTVVLMHEFGHSLAAQKLGYQIKEIMLHPFGGFAIIGNGGGNKDWRKNHLHEFWITLCGPLVNVFLLMLVVPPLLVWGSDGWMSLVWMFYKFNWILLGLNLIPVYPLDGGRLMRCALTWFMGGNWEQSTKYAKRVTLCCLIGVVPFFIYYGWWMAAIILPLVALLGLSENVKFEEAQKHNIPTVTFKMYINGVEFDGDVALKGMRQEQKLMERDDVTDTDYYAYLSENIRNLERIIRDVRDSA